MCIILGCDCCCVVFLQLNGFVERYSTDGVATTTPHQPHQPPHPHTPHTPHQMNSPLMLIESFLQALTNADKDGRIVVSKKSKF